MWTIDNLRRPDCDGREEARRASVEARRHGVVHHIQTAADIFLAESLQLIEMLLYVGPWPM